MESDSEILPPESILNSQPEYANMDKAAQTTANLQASAAALNVLLSIQDGRNHIWTSARWILREDRRKLLRAEVFIAAIEGAFKAMARGESFPHSRASLTNNNAVIKAAEDAANGKIEEIKARLAEKRAVEEAKKASEHQEKKDGDYEPGAKKRKPFTDGANLQRTISDPSTNISRNDDNPDEDEYNDNGDHVPLYPPIQGHVYKFWPPLPEDMKKPEAVADAAEKPRMTGLRRADYVYKPPFPTADPRHPSVIEYERKSGVKNVVGTGLNGELTTMDILTAIVVVDNRPEHLKTSFMNPEQKKEYEAKRAKEAKQAAEAAAKAKKGAEDNQAAKLRIAAGDSDYEQEHLPRKSKAGHSKPPRFDPENRGLGGDAQDDSPLSPLRKRKHRSVVPDSESPDTVASSGADIFQNVGTPSNFKTRRGRRQSSGSSFSVVVRENGSPVPVIQPPKLGSAARLGMSPAPGLETIARKLAKPATRQQRRELTGSTDELTRPRSPRPAVRKSIRSAAAMKKTPARLEPELNFSSRDSVAAPSDDSALVPPSPSDDLNIPGVDNAIATKRAARGRGGDASTSLEFDVGAPGAMIGKRRRESTASRDRSPFFPPVPSPKKRQTAKLKQQRLSLRSASPAPSILSTAASDRPRRGQETMMRQSLPATGLFKKSAASRSMMRQSPLTSMSTSQTVMNSARSSAAAAAKKKLKDEDIINKPVEVTNEEYNVEAIVNHKLHAGRIYYRVKWDGYEESENTWEPASNLHDAQKILNDYRSSLHKDDKVEDIIAHRKVMPPGTYNVRVTEFQVKWAGSLREFNSWETEEKILQKGGLKVFLYYRIRKNVGFGSGMWSKVKEAQARRLLMEAGLEPEVGGRIKPEKNDAKQGSRAGGHDGEDEGDELGMSDAAGVYESANEDVEMNQTI